MHTLGRRHGARCSCSMRSKRANDRQKHGLFAKLRRCWATCGEDHRGVGSCVQGADRRHARESRRITLIEALLDAKATVRAHDPEAMTVARGIWGDRVVFAPTNYDAP